MSLQRSSLRVWTAYTIDFIRLGRFPFLTGGFILYALGAIIAAYEGAKVNWLVYICGQIIVTATQLMVHYANDYYDLAADRLNRISTMWSGGSRVLVDGELPPRVAQITAIGCGLIALIGSVLLIVADQNIMIGLLLFPAIILSWFYSAPPVRLHSHGIGEVSATLVVAVLTPLTAYYLQAGRLTLLPIVAVIPISLLQFNMLISVAMPDMEGDALAGKQTLVVRYGRKAAANIYLCALILAYALLPIWIVAGLPTLVAGGFSLSLFLSMPLGWWMWRGAWSRPAAYGWIAFMSIALLIAAAVLETFTFALMTAAR